MIIKIINAINEFLRRLKYVSKNIMGLPLIGEFHNKFFIEPPRLLTKKFGKASFSPIVVEIPINDNTGIEDAGKIVNDLYFKKKPPIMFNVCFACARPSLFKGGDYANPESHWFNVFFGFYEIDVDAALWKRPFGFKNASANDLDFDDLLKIGKSDWNFFSNYLYGVPKNECLKYSSLTDSIKTSIINTNITIGTHKFIEAEVSGVKVVSAYVSKQDNKKLLKNDGILTTIWQSAFGRPKPSNKYPDSFIPATMKLHFYIRFEKSFDHDLNSDAYKTYIYGGTINMDYNGSVNNDDFLKAQLEAVRASASKIAFKKRLKWFKTP